MTPQSEMRRSQISSATLATLATLAVLSACSRFDSARTSDSAAAKTAAGTTTPGATGDGTRVDTASTVTATGYGELRIGMTVANAAIALKSAIPSTAGLDTACAYIHIAKAPPGLRIMIVGGTVARIEIDSSSIATGLGARVGDSESRVRELYGSRVTVEPHKYLPHGHYMVVAPIPPTDAGFRLIFETDGSRVTKYRAGRLPQVQWVEGCA
jgi:hypothetical protein